MRLWIAAFLLLLLACQTLPVSSLGKVFAKVKVQLSVVDDDDLGNDESNSQSHDINAKLKKQAPLLEEDFLHHYTDAIAFSSLQASQLLFLYRADHLPLHYAGEVATPPPNHC